MNATGTTSRTTTAFWSTLLALAVASWLALGFGCREKDPVGPNGEDPTGNWEIFLTHADTLHYSYQDTITVRVFQPSGQVGVNVDIRPVCGAGPDNVPAEIRGQSDTTAFPWGAHPPLRYFGNDTNLTSDWVTCYVVVGQDTVAQQTTTFFLPKASNF